MIAAVCLAPALVLVTLRTGFDPVEHQATRPMIHRADDSVGPQVCKACHPDQHQSWHKTFHRTMTQRADRRTIQGRFDGREVRIWGKVAKVGIVYRNRAHHYMDLPASKNGPARRAWVEDLAVGSRRYQQYFERVGWRDGRQVFEWTDGDFVYRRLPLLWDIVEQRWTHIDAVFLEPDTFEDVGGGYTHWDKPPALWNNNCIFCHNTAPKPAFQNYDQHPPESEMRFDSRVAELGISCEACHGPGRRHVEKFQDPVARYAAAFRGDGTGSDQETHIVNPEHLDKERSVAICGQCHGQRLPHGAAQLKTFLRGGPTFRPGDRLEQHVQPLAIHTVPPGVDLDPKVADMFRLRFWADGTPRLTAYEYQGVVASPCYQRGDMTCISCHSMHGGDPRGMLEPEMAGNQACLQCHEEIGRDVAKHTGHKPDSSGSSCLACHMPKIVYGVATIHRSHRIENPDPARDAELGRPNACALCHLDKSPVWAAQSMAKIWGGRGKSNYRLPKRRRNGASLQLSDAMASLLGGDPVQRAVYARAMGRQDSAMPANEKAFARLALTVTLGDAYPSVRRIARQSLLALEQEHPLGGGEGLRNFDYLAPAADRRRRAMAILRDFPRQMQGRMRPPGAGLLLGRDFVPDGARLAALLKRQSKTVISIGE